MTELEAVNRILITIGEQPVSSLSVSGVVEVAVAQATLTNTSREVQSVGWHFNTDQSLILSKDTDGHIIVPSNALRVDTVGPSRDIDVTLRGYGEGLVLYDLKNHTTVFDDDVTVDCVYCLDWADIIQEARWYITVKAARRFSNSVQQSAMLYQFTEEDEKDALAKLKDAEADYGDNNILTDNWLGYMTTRREDSQQ